VALSLHRMPFAPGLTPQRVRDLLVFTHAGELVVVATDSAGGVGPKPGDRVRVSARVVGMFTARVALMEVLACGARPHAVALCCCNEPEPAAAEVRAGVLREMARLRLAPCALVISSEKNFSTVQTGVGVTVLGFCRPEEFMPGRAQPGERVLVVGSPKVGAKVTPDDPELADLPLVARLLRLRLASDLLPVGSRGIGPEARALASSAGLGFIPSYPEDLDPQASAGPATALLAAVPPGAVRAMVQAAGPVPCRDVGCLVPAGEPGGPPDGVPPERGG